MTCFCNVPEDEWVWVQGLLVLMSMIDKNYENNDNIVISLEPMWLKSAFLPIYIALSLMNRGNNNGRLMLMLNSVAKTSFWLFWYDATVYFDWCWR